MKLKSVFKRLSALALSSALAMGLLPMLPAQEAEAADFSLGSGFSDPTITVATMYYWKEGLPPVVKNRDGKMEGSTVGVEYPVIISWGDDNGTQYYINITDTTPIRSSWQNGEQYPAIKNYLESSIDHDDNNYNQTFEKQYYHGLPAGWWNPMRGYSNKGMVGLFDSMDIAQSLRESGVAASMSSPTNMYLVPVGEAYGYQHYGLEIGEDSGRWLVGEHFFRSNTRRSRGYDNSLDWYLEVRDVDKANFADVNWRMPAKYAYANNVSGYDSSADYTTSSFPHRTWDFARTSDGYYTIATDGDAGWYVEDGGGSSVDEWQTTQHDYVKGGIWNSAETWLRHSYSKFLSNIWHSSYIYTVGGWHEERSHGSVADSLDYKYRVFYGEPNLVSFLQSDTRVQSGQVVNLDGPIVIGENATVTVEDGGVLVVSGWVMNGGYIMVKPGGMLIVQDQERLDGTKQYGVINSFFKKDSTRKNGRIACDGIMIVNRDCKVIGSGRYGLQFGAGAHCVNYGQLVGSHMEVYSDHTIENRGSSAAVFAGYVLEGDGFALANQKLTAGDLDGLMSYIPNATVKTADNAVYGSAGWKDGRLTASREPPKANRAGHVTDVDPYISTYAVETDAAQGVSFVKDSAGRRYDWYDSLHDYVRFDYVGGSLTSYVFGGRAVPETPPTTQRASNVADFDAARRQFFVRDNGVTYWYDPEKAAFLDENALTDAYYPGTPVFPGGVLGAEIILETGEFYLESTAATGLRATVTPKGNTYELTMQKPNAANDVAQRLRFTKHADGRYVITNDAHKELALTIKDGAQLELTTYGAGNQSFLRQDAGGGSYYFVVQGPAVSVALSLLFGQTGEGAAVRWVSNSMRSFDQDGNCKWKLVKAA